MTTPFDEVNKVESFLDSCSSKVQDNILSRIMNIMENDPLLKGLYRFNEFSYDVEHTGPVGWSNGIKEGEAVTDNDIVELMTYIAKKYNFAPNRQRLEDTVQSLALRKRYHPIKDYLESLQWDGIERLNRWLIEIAGADDTPYTQAVGTKVLVAAVTRIYHPGCQYDYMMILEGKQGIKKTTLLRTLGGEYYSTMTFAMDNKKVVDVMRGKWILEVKEMHGFDKAERTKIKDMIDQTTDRVRLSYGRRAQDFKRHTVIIGTMNPEGENKYLGDEENRRFWPISCPGMIDIDKLIGYRDQLFAEAMYRMKQGEKLYLENIEIENLAKKEQEIRMLNPDPWEEKVRKYLDELERKMQNQVTVTQIMEECLKIPPERWNRGFAGRVGRAVNKHGRWELKRNTTRRDKSYYYQLITDSTTDSTTYDEINWEGEQAPTQPTGTQIEPTGSVAPSQE